MPADEQPDRGKGEIDRVHPGFAELLAQGAPAQEQFPDGGGAEIAEELGGEREPKDQRRDLSRARGVAALNTTAGPH